MSEPAAGLLQVSYTVADDASPPPALHSFDLFYRLEANTGRLSITWDPSTNTVECDQVVFDGTTNTSAPLPGCVGAHPAPDTFTLTFPVANILPTGLAVRGAILRDLWVGSYIGALLDQLPGEVGSNLVRPERADPYVLYEGGVSSVLGLPGRHNASVEEAIDFWTRVNDCAHRVILRDRMKPNFIVTRGRQCAATVVAWSLDAVGHVWPAEIDGRPFTQMVVDFFAELPPRAR